MTKVDASRVVERFTENGDIPAVKEVGVKTETGGVAVCPGKMSVHVLALGNGGTAGKQKD
jgi:hypothetical protein